MLTTVPPVLEYLLVLQDQLEQSESLVELPVLHQALPEEVTPEVPVVPTVTEVASSASPVVAFEEVEVFEVAAYSSLTGFFVSPVRKIRQRLLFLPVLHSYT